MERISHTFQDLKICTSSLTQHDKRQLGQLVRQHGGLFCNDFDKSVRYIVVGAVGSSKYAYAIRWGTHIVDAEWVRQCVAKRTLLDHSDFAVPPLAGLSISITGLHAGGERDRLGKLIQQSGAKYARTLEVSTTTHLISRETAGLKYEAATENGIHVVAPEWVYECARLGHWIPEDKFAVGGAAIKQEATPTATSHRKTGVTPISGLKRSYSASSTTVEATRHGTPTPQKRPTVNDNPEQLEKVLAALKFGGQLYDFFSDFNTFLVGFDEDAGWSRMETLLQIGGATVFWEWNPLVTHVIVGPLVDKEMTYIQLIKSQAPGTIFLQPVYVLDTYLEKQRLGLGNEAHVWPRTDNRRDAGNLGRRPLKGVSREPSLSSIGSASHDHTNKSASGAFVVPDLENHQVNNSTTEAQTTASRKGRVPNTSTTKQTSTGSSTRIRGKRVCISQFVGHQKQPVIELINSCGGTFDNVLRKGITELLIVKECCGVKYEKALEWGIPVMDMIEAQQHAAQQQNDNH